MQKFTVAASHIVSACVNKIESQPTKFFFNVPFYYLNKPFLLYICLRSKVHHATPDSVTSTNNLERTGKFQRQTAGGRLTLRASRRML